MKIIKTFIIFLSITISQKSFSQCWTQIAAGEYHTVGIKSDGTLWAWGNNDYGQLGDGTTTNKTVPTQIGTDTDWAIIDAFYWNTFAIKTDGSLWGWGNNFSGQLGDGNFGNGVISNTPMHIGTDTDWIKIVPGGILTFALKSNGTIWGWGYNQDGRMGTGDFNNHYIPIQIGIETDWVDINTGGNQTLALKSNHTLWGWGLNKRGSLAIGEPSETTRITIPTQTGINTADWAKIEAGPPASSKMIKMDGSLWAMGLGTFGNIGNGDVLDLNIPTQVGTDTNWSTVTTSGHSCGIKTDGTLWVWGLNFAGQLGDGTFTNRTMPTQIGIDKTWLSVKTGDYHTIALSSDNTLYAWGYNNKGQLGDGTLIDKATITQIGNSCPLSTSSFETLQSLRAIPNPSTNTTVIRFVATENMDISVTLTNNLGQIVYQKNKTTALGENQESIDLTALSAGVYCITLSTNKQQSTIKIIKN